MVQVVPPRLAAGRYTMDRRFEFVVPGEAAYDQIEGRRDGGIQETAVVDSVIREGKALVRLAISAGAISAARAALADVHSLGANDSEIRTLDRELQRARILAYVDACVEFGELERTAEALERGLRDFPGDTAISAARERVRKLMDASDPQIARREQGGVVTLTLDAVARRVFFEQNPDDLASGVTTEDVGASGGRRGVRIASIASGHIAHTLGARSGDLIISVDGQSVLTRQDAMAVIKRVRKFRREPIKVGVLRENQEIQFVIEIHRAWTSFTPDQSSIAEHARNDGSRSLHVDRNAHNYLFGLGPDRWTEGILTDDLTGSQSGVRISRVPRDSVGFLFGLASGDVVRSINGHSVSSRAEAIDVLGDVRPYSRTVRVALWREGKELVLEVDPREPLLREAR